ncbi:flagellar filament capping protein FliD [Pelagicoccus sp. SDUM812002]|uniref:flagellar filament capping protein FliD n=1 Tax=Pelagicoccus sp. SDUM812002 TaxID=3041266 RepID=UPI00280D21BC|nr:flagellar filament capping protein FliD [Pelagicoccus sp. SDUM812002]MDQ8186177.1 flagellar filament capping protein FliD [Pelagicoccus sp. SDUM812002]
MENFNVAGLASGFDWNSMVDQLMAIERIPQQRLNTEKGDNEAKVDALKALKTKLDKLKSSTTDLKSSTLYNSKSAESSDETLNISASAGTNASRGNFEITVSQLATATRRIGTADVVSQMGDENSLISALRVSTEVSDGTFSVNGQEVTIAGTDSLQDVFDAISIATAGVVTGSYDSVTDTISLESASGQLELGGDEDTSNFLTAMKLHQLEVQDGGSGTAVVSSRSALGVVDVNDNVANSGIGGPITGSDTFYINGVAINFDADSESISTILERVNESDAGVTMSFDSSADQFRIINNETGAYTMNVADSGNGFLAAIGLTGSADIGKDLRFSMDDGAIKTSRSNNITAESHGLTGVTISASETGTQTITIDSDSEELKAKINSFISAFNDVQDYIGEKTKIEVDGDEVKTSVLSGNRELSSLDSKLRSFAFAQVDELASGKLFRLEHLGIDFISGTSKLEIKDSAKLDEALVGNIDKLEQFFVGAETNFSGRLDSFLENFLKSDGVMDTISSSYSERNSDIDEQIKDMERRLEFKRATLESSFIAMEEAQSKTQNQATALAGLSLP